MLVCAVQTLKKCETWLPLFLQTEKKIYFIMQLFFFNKSLNGLYSIYGWNIWIGSLGENCFKWNFSQEQLNFIHSSSSNFATHLRSYGNYSRNICSIYNNCRITITETMELAQISLLWKFILNDFWMISIIRMMWLFEFMWQCRVHMQWPIFF